MSDKIVHTSDADFESDVLKSDKPVLVDYWAEWCGPCKMIAPILDEIAGEYGDKIKICKLDIDANQETPPKYGIRGIPTLMLFKNGEVEATKVGALSKSQLNRHTTPSAHEAHGKLAWARRNGAWSEGGVHELLCKSPSHLLHEVLHEFLCQKVAKSRKIRLCH